MSLLTRKNKMSDKQDISTRKITEKQENAILKMRWALGYRDAFKDMPETLIEASKEIRKLHSVIEHNLSVGGTINPEFSSLCN